MKRRPVDWERILHVPETVRLAQSVASSSMPSASVMAELASTELREWQDLGMIREDNEPRRQYSLTSHPQILQPMLSSPITGFDEIRFGQTSEYVYEEKFDGERMLCFVKSGDDVDNAVFYSRTLKPLKFPYRIPLLPGHRDCILDGELVFLDPETKSTIPICDTGDRRLLHKQYRVFDIQMLDGEYTQDRPLLERKRLLTEVLGSSDHVALVEFHEVLSREQLISAFDHVIAEGGEGLILKRTRDCYMAGLRKWIKLKELHINGRKLEFDLYVNRMLYDKNNILSVLECGYFEDNNAFRRVCLVSSGLDTKTRTRIRRLSANWGSFEPRSLVVTIIADKITKNGSLRHPVFYRIRDDLSGCLIEIDPRLLVPYT